MRAYRWCAALLLTLPWTGSTWAATLTFVAPNVANPPSVTLANGNVGVADTLKLSDQNVRGVILSQTLDAQGFTAANNWNYSLMHITSLANNAKYTVTDGAGNFGNGNPIVGYKLRSSGGNPSSNNKLDESMHVTFNIGATTPPAPTGATVTQHWIQVLNEDRQYGGYGFQIAGQNGYWQIDNNDKTFTAGSGVTPFYDVAFGGWSATEIGDDPTVLNDGKLGAYLHFYTLPVWDAQTTDDKGNTVHTLYVGDPGFQWGFSVVPEPSSLTMLVVAMPAVLVIWYRKGREGVGDGLSRRDAA